MTFKHRLRLGLRRFGVEVSRYRPTTPLVSLLERFGIETVIDIGANDGGFGTLIRSAGYRGRIVSFEPLSSPFKALSRAIAHDPMWTAYQYAIGDQDREVEINVAGNSGASSSLLPMLDAHVDAAPDAVYVGLERATMRRLDDVLPGIGLTNGDRMFVKIDVQGFESMVLDGAPKLLAEGGIVGLQLELSIVPLYEGSMTYREGLDRIEALGMRLMGIEPGFLDPRSGQLLQFDGIFFRGDRSGAGL